MGIGWVAGSWHCRVSQAGVPSITLSSLGGGGQGEAVETPTMLYLKASEGFCGEPP